MEEGGLHSHLHQKQPVGAAVLSLAQKLGATSHKRKAAAFMKNKEILDFVETVGVALRQKVERGSSISAASV